MRAPCVLGLVMLLAACAPQQKLLRHYDSFPQAADRTPALTLSVFLANPEAEESRPFILQLSERAQAELIRSATAKADPKEGNAELFKLLAAPVNDAPEKCAWARKARISKRLVVNVLGDLPKPADRIDKLDIVLTLEGGNAGRAQFLSWDRYTSKYGDFNIGTAKFTQANKFTAGLGNTSSSSTVDPTSALEKVFSAGYERSNALEESASYALRRLTVGGELSADRARLVQEGAPNYTLFGSSVAAVSLALTSVGVQRVHAFELMENDKLRVPAAVKMESCADVQPDASAAIEVKVSGTAWLRLVKSGDATVSEGDDAVEMVTQPLIIEKPVTLVTANELAVERFKLGICSYPAPRTSSCRYLYVARDGTRVGNYEPVVLPSLERAAELRGWLIEQSKTGPVSTIANHPIGLGGEAPVDVTAITPAETTTLVAIAVCDLACEKSRMTTSALAPAPAPAAPAR